MVGEEQPVESSGDKEEQSTYLVYTHMKFSIGHKGNRIIEVFQPEYLQYQGLTSSCR